MNAVPVDCWNQASRRESRTWTGGAIRTLVAVVIAAVLIGPGGTAGASIGWCKSDPAVKIGRNVVDIVLTAPADAPLKVTGPNEIVVIVPESVSALAIRLVGFGRGETVSVVHSKKLDVTEDGIEVEVQAFVPASDDTMPVTLDFAPNLIGLLDPASAQGVANTWITLETRL